jgi:hypothetical protein
MTDDAPKEELDGEEANEVARRYGEVSGFRGAAFIALKLGPGHGWGSLKWPPGSIAAILSAIRELMNPPEPNT